MQLTFNDIVQICNDHNLCTHGTTYQYDRIEDAIFINAEVTVIASIIWACSDVGKTVEEIVDLLLAEDEKRYKKHKQHTFTYKQEYGHYVLYLDGQFYCTCDNISEVDEEMENYYANES